MARPSIRGLSPVRSGILLVVALLAAPAWATEASQPPESDASATADEWDEQVAVTAEIGGSTHGPLGASSTVIEPGHTAGTASAVADLLVAAPGVSENGQGGLLQVVSIRGVSGQRVLNLVSGMRITGERRAGVSASFIDPLLLGTVEVLRGPSTTYYGAGGLGGVVQLFPRDFDEWTWETGYDSDGDENYQIAGTGGEGWSVGVSRRHAADGEAADGTRLNSHFTQYSAVAKLGWDRGQRRFELLAIPTYAEDIGKANTDYPDRTTNYPRERHALMQFSVESERGWRFHSFVHPQDLQTEVVRAGDSRSLVRNDSFDFGLGLESRAEVGNGVILRLGADGFGRRGVDAIELQQDLDPIDPAPVSTTRTLDGADSFEGGLYGAARWQWAGATWEGGAHWSWIGQRNADGGDRKRNAWNGFVGVSRSVGQAFELRGSVSSGIRFPSLTEQFFTGTTGRGQVIGNPDLVRERSLNGEVSLRWLGRRVLISGTLFRNRIADYIEQVTVESKAVEDLRTFVNLTSGSIRGVEIQGLYTPRERWMLDWGGHLLDGEASDGSPLADVPSDELYLGMRHEAGPWSSGTRLTRRRAKNDPGDGENAIPSAWLLGARIGYRWAPRWLVALGADNLLDQEYFRSADDKAPLAPGRSVSLQLNWGGRR